MIMKIYIMLFLGLILGLLVAYYNLLPLFPTIKKKVGFLEDMLAYRGKHTNMSGKLDPPEIPSRFLIEEADFCSRQELQVIAYIHSAINEIDKRRLTRSTWATAVNYDDCVKVGVVFMVGRAKTREEQKIVEEESRLHHDIVQGNYSDTFHLLSFKALASLVWVFRHCSYVPWLVHADDDVLIDLFFLSRILKTLPEKDKFLCYFWESAAVRREGKWYVEKREYPESEYPPYCSGAVWVISTKVVHLLLQAAVHTPILWVDDVYITGILAQNANIGHSKEMMEYFSKDSIGARDIGIKIAWIHLQDRYYWWKKILHYYGYERQR